MGEYDLIIIGSGAAGFSAATQARHLGAERVAIIERGTLWGTCVNFGCVPSKLLITVGELLYYRNYRHPGLEVTSRFSLAATLQEKQDIIRRSLERKQQALVGELGVDIIRGEAAFVSPDAVRAGGEEFSAPRFIIATGSKATIPRIDGIETVDRPMTSTEALEPDAVPGRLIVVGGRALGLEFAQLYAHLGSAVTVLQRSSSLVPEEEPVLARLLAESLAEEGLAIRTGAGIRRIAGTGGGVRVEAAIGGEETTVEADRILFATGRSPNTRELRPELAGVTLGKNGEVLVDRFLRTSAPHIWAVGDVLGEPQLEVAAKAGGVIAAENAIAGRGRVFDTAALPHAVFTTPQLAAVGMTEARARAAGIQTVSRCIRMDTLVKSAIAGDTRGMVKIVAEAGTERICGVHIIAPLAADMIQEGVLAVKHGLSVQDIISTFHVFPTMTEAIWVCARAFRHPSSGPCDAAGSPGKAPGAPGSQAPQGRTGEKLIIKPPY
ncbi:MAG TPA: mercury(II) reductase [Methanoregula sp.]|nr:mercury(II) reductase [Methanoregula sp.]